MNKLILERRLMETGYAALFLHGVASKANSFWENGTYKKELDEIVNSETSEPHAKFLAAEILRNNGISPDNSLAGPYVTALQHSSEDADDFWQINANAWAELFETSTAGPLGAQLLSFGESAVPYLQLLLDDDRPILYDGSEEATIGNAYRYRIKDFAAYFISTIRNSPLVLSSDPLERDRSIEQLRSLL